jgi:hypothetical protein
MIEISRGKQVSVCRADATRNNRTVVTTAAQKPVKTEGEEIERKRSLSSLTPLGERRPGGNILVRKRFSHQVESENMRFALKLFHSKEAVVSSSELLRQHKKHQEYRQRISKISPKAKSPFVGRTDLHLPQIKSKSNAQSML